jgi:hypothetical protein
VVHRKAPKLKKRDFGSDCPAPGGVPGLAVTGEIALKKAGAKKSNEGRLRVAPNQAGWSF